MDANDIATDSAPLYLRAVGGVACRDCNAWAHAGDPIRHGKRCDFRDAQSVTRTAPVVKAALVRDGQISAAFDGDEDQIVNYVRAGVLSMSSAMNRDD